MAQFRLGQLLPDLYKELGQLNVSVATGGSTTTIADTKLVGRYADGVWIEGAAGVIYDAGGAGATPQNEFNRISNYVDSTGTLTVDTAFVGTPASGDVFWFANEFYPLRILVELINDGLRSLGDITLVDTTTLDTAVQQTEYAASVTWKHRRPRAIAYQGRTGDANDNRWIQIHDVDFIPAAGGSTGLIILPQLPATRDIRVIYEDSHPRLSIYSDSVNEAINPQLAIKACAVQALQWQNSRLQGSDTAILQRLNQAQADLALAKGDLRPYKYQKRRKIFSVGGSHIDEDEFQVPTG